MADTKLTHKLRNPKSYNDWMNIWTSYIKDGNNNTYNIYPSSHWKIPISQLTSNEVNEQNGDQTVIENATANLPNTITIPANQVVNAEKNNETIHNVTTSKPSSSSYSENALTKFDSSGNLVAGPTINASSGANNKILNEKGNWITITADKGLKVNPENSSSITIEHTNSITAGTIGSSSATNGPTLTFPYVTYDAQGHIKTTGTYIHTINGLTDTNINTISSSKISDLATSIVTTITNPNTTGILNTKANNGIVKAGDSYTNTVWLTDSDDNPDWGKVTADHMDLANESISGEILEKESVPSNTFDTRLLGAFISEDEPTLIQDWETAEYNLYSDIPIIKTHTYDFDGRSSDSATSLQFKLQIQEEIVTEEGQRKIIFNITIKLPTNSTVSQDYLNLELSYLNNIDFLSMDSVFTEALGLYNNELQGVQSYAQMISTDGALGHICLAIKNRLIAYYNSSSTYAKSNGLATIPYSKMMLPEELNPWDYNHCGIWIEI